MAEERRTRREEPTAQEEETAAGTSEDGTSEEGPFEEGPFEEESQPAATVPAAAVPTPGEPPGAIIPEVHAVQADDEEGEVKRVRGVAHAPPGKPDGEVDTRP